MRPYGPLTISAGNGPVLPLDIYGGGYPAVRMSVNEAAIGSLTYVVEFTTQNPFDPAYNAATAVWNTIAAAPVTNGAVYDISGQPCAAMRIRITGGAGTLTYYLMQQTSGQ